MHLFTNWIKQKWKIEFECKCFPSILKVKYYASISWKFILLSRWILVQIMPINMFKFVQGPIIDKIANMYIY